MALTVINLIFFSSFFPPLLSKSLEPIRNSLCSTLLYVRNGTVTTQHQIVWAQDWLKAFASCVQTCLLQVIFKHHQFITKNSCLRSYKLYCLTLKLMISPDQIEELTAVCQLVKSCGLAFFGGGMYLVLACQ